MTPLFPVMLGGAIGAGLRYITAVLLMPRMQSGWPWATFAVNLLGGFAMGLLFAHLMKGNVGETTRLFVGVGILGGFTTFSAFSLESWQMIERGNWALAGGYALASVIGSIMALGSGIWMARA
ncbi:MAG: fluoride efflux transporter CrcB [Chakrabartia sp.]